MKVLKPQKLGLLHRCFDHEHRQYLSVAVLSLHQLDGAMLSEMDMWKFLPQELGADGIPDSGMVKTRGEVLVTGSAYQPGGVAGPSSSVRVQVGAVDKVLQVLGDRDWDEHGRVVGPAPFVQMPITWEHAFGGEGFEQNPLGKGYLPPPEPEEGEDEATAADEDPASAGEDEVSEPIVPRPLPNLELPDQLIRSVDDRPEPASLGPIDFTWPQRQNKIGTYDQQWLEERFPGYAADMDWSIFNMAAEDQQLASFFEGNESYSIEGMHPEKPVLKGVLPGIRSRCFVTQAGDEGEEFLEVPLGLSTVWFFPHAERFLLVFHGTAEVVEDDAADIVHILVAAEELGQARPEAHYLEGRDRRLDPEHGALNALLEEDLLPEAERYHSAPDQGSAEMEALLATEGLQEKHQRRRMEIEHEERRAQIASMGLDPDALVPPLPAEESTPELSELPELVAEKEAEAERAKLEAEEDRKAQEEILRQQLTEQGLDADAIIEEAKAPPSGPPAFRAADDLAHKRSQLELARSQGYSEDQLAKMKQAIEDPDYHQRLLDAEKAGRDGYLLAAHHQAAAPRLEGEVAAEARAAVLAGLAERGNLSRTDLTGFDLSGLDLSGVDLSESWLENTDLTGTNLSGANLTRAVLARAELTETNLTGANLEGASLALAQLTRVQADDTNLAGVTFDKARLEESSLKNTNLAGVTAMEVSASNTDFSGASAAEVTFLKVVLSGCSWAGAELGKCVFLESDLSGSDFSSAQLVATSFVESKGEGAVFAGADMSKTVFVEACDFTGADFRGATLEAANLRGTQLAGGDFSGATLAMADLSEADLTGGKLQHIAAPQSLLVRTKLRDADLRSADLMTAVLQKADLRGANLEAANLYGADLALVRMDEGTNLAETNQTKARTLPKFGGPQGSGQDLPWGSA